MQTVFDEANQNWIKLNLRTKTILVEYLAQLKSDEIDLETQQEVNKIFNRDNFSMFDVPKYLNKLTPKELREHKKTLK